MQRPGRDGDLMVEAALLDDAGQEGIPSTVASGWRLGGHPATNCATQRRASWSSPAARQRRICLAVSPIVWSTEVAIAGGSRIPTSRNRSGALGPRAAA
jgi:hypothetical protein